MKAERIANLIWYEDHPLGLPLRPLSWIFGGIVRLRRWLYRRELLPSGRAPLPVIVVGNITVGGVGKTPLVIALVELLRDEGLRPGVVSRGYGGTQKVPRLLIGTESPAQVGDEPCLILRRARCPVVVGADRVAASQLLCDADCDVIISDDGLQHYALERDIEIVVIDGMRRLGNGRLLPSGPLREPRDRLAEVDFVLVNGRASRPNEVALKASSAVAVRLRDSEARPLSAFAEQPVFAIAGIGNPDRFFDALHEHGVEAETRAFPDHHPFRRKDLAAAGKRPILMTDKDAVKCMEFSDLDIWVVPLTLEIPQPVATRLLALLHSR